MRYNNKYKENDNNSPITTIDVIMNNIVQAFETAAISRKKSTQNLVNTNVQLTQGILHLNCVQFSHEILHFIENSLNHHYRRRQHEQSTIHDNIWHGEHCKRKSEF